MHSSLRASLPAKIVALSFILMILVGNFWLVASLLGSEPTVLMQGCFLLGMLGAFSGGACLAFLAWKRGGHEVLPSQHPSRSDEDEL